MAQLTPDEYDIVAQNPLQDILESVRNALRETCPLSRGSIEDQNQHQRPKMFAAVMSKLFSILSASDAPLSLASRNGRDSLAQDLVLVRSMLQKGGIRIDVFRPLSQLLLDHASDAEIWTAVIVATMAIFRSTALSSRGPSHHTPITHSSASQQGSDQTRQKIEPRVFEEIRNCTYRAVEGFHEKYFEGKRWERRAKRSWKILKAQYNEEERRWANLSNTPTEDECCTWWMNLSDVLSREKNAYFRSSPSNPVGVKETKRQLDLIVKSRRAIKEGERHNWADVLVVGELKRSEKISKTLWLQLGSAVRQVFASQPTRRFVHAFSFTGTKMENWIFDRSGPYSGIVFDVNDEPEKFIRTMCGYLMMSDEELGIDIFMIKKDGKLLVAVPEGARRGKKRKLELEVEPIAFQRAIVCRGTACYRSKAGHSGFDGVVKFSWTSEFRPPEADLLHKANERGVKGLAKLVGHDEITSIRDLRHGLEFADSHRFRDMRKANTSTSQSLPPPSHSFSQFRTLTITKSQSRKRKSSHTENSTRKRAQSNSSALREEILEKPMTYAVQAPAGTSLVPADSLPYSNRIFRVLAISPAGRSISGFRSIPELLEGLRDAIKVHQSLFLDGQILHRDISENNIIIPDSPDADGFKGMLIDLDLAKEEGKGPSGARHRTGTLEFMAIEVLLQISHTYRHDLEAFFYVLIWLCAKRGWVLFKSGARPPKKSMLPRWYSGSYESIAQAKRGDMDKNGLEVMLREFPPEMEWVKPLCRTVRDVLFPYKDGLFTGTPEDPSVLYEPIIEAFDDALVTIGQRDITS